MARLSSKRAATLVCSLLTLNLAKAQSVTTTTASTATVGTATIAGTVVTYKPQFTVPASADVGVTLIPNIQDPLAVDAQTVCPGYTASKVVRNAYGFSATLSLAGKPCNVYGTDVDTLSLAVQFQNEDRLSISIQPTNLVSDYAIDLSLNLFSFFNGEELGY
jgi:alpha-glucosidase